MKRIGILMLMLMTLALSLFANQVTVPNAHEQTQVFQFAAPDGVLVSDTTYNSFGLVSFINEAVSGFEINKLISLDPGGSNPFTAITQTQSMATKSFTELEVPGFRRCT